MGICPRGRDSYSEGMDKAPTSTPASCVATHRRLGHPTSGLRWAVRSFPASEAPGEQRARAQYPHLHVLDFPRLESVSLSQASDLALKSCAHGEAGDVDEAELDDKGASIIEPLARQLHVPSFDDPHLQAITRHGFDPAWSLMCSTGSGYHYDYGSWWDGALFCVVVLDARDVVFRMPQIGAEVPLVPGRMVIFDPTLVHGVCHAADRGLFRTSSFEGQRPLVQTYLTRTVRLAPEQWAELQCPWQAPTDSLLRGHADLAPAACNSTTGRLTAA